MGRLTDSSTLIHLERQGKGLDFLTAVYPDDPVIIASITASELISGILLSKSPIHRERRHRWVHRVLGSVRVIPFDLAVARVHARLWAKLESAGQKIGAHDTTIAATTLAYGHSVLTFNVREFERVPGLVVERPDW